MHILYVRPQKKTNKLIDCFKPAIHRLLETLPQQEIAAYSESVVKQFARKVFFFHNVD